MNHMDQQILSGSRKVCRTCMSSETELISLSAFVTISEKQESLSNILVECTSIQVDESDGLPQEICNNCVEKLMICFLYRELSHETQNRLQLLYQCVTYSEIPQSNSNTDEIPINNTGTVDNIENLVKDLRNESTIQGDNPFMENFDCKSEYFDCYDPDNSSLKEDHSNINNSNIPSDNVEKKQSNFCVFCSKEISPQYMKRHMKTHSNSDDLKCNICLKQFTRATDVKRHMSVHTGLKPYVCTVCNSSFTQSGTLLKHMRKHDGFQKLNNSTKFSEGLSHLCSICGKAFKQSSCLTVHMRRHLGDKPYCCKVCNLRFVSSGRLTSHMRVHTGERPFVCKICGKRFAQSSVASKHMKSHLNDKSYKCGCCPKSFSTLYYLNIHKRKHTGEKPHECPECHKTFADPKNLKQHKKVHSNEKPFLCILCGKPFRRSHHLKYHMKIHSKGNVC